MTVIKYKEVYKCVPVTSGEGLDTMPIYSEVAGSLNSIANEAKVIPNKIVSVQFINKKLCYITYITHVEVKK